MPQAWFNVFLPLFYDRPEWIEGAKLGPAVRELVEALSDFSNRERVESDRLHQTSRELTQTLAKFTRREQIDSSKFQQTEQELIERFGGLTIFREPTFLTQGFWRRKGGTLSQDDIRIYAVFSEDSEADRVYFFEMKAEWKQRFQQDEIFIVELEARVV